MQDELEVLWYLESEEYRQYVVGSSENHSKVVSPYAEGCWRCSCNEYYGPTGKYLPETGHKCRHVQFVIDNMERFPPYDKSLFWERHRMEYVGQLDRV